MQKLLVFFLALIAVYYVRRWLQGQSARPVPRADEAARTPAEGHAEVMRECAHCGLLIPESEAVSAEGNSFCCAEHARLGASRERS